MTNEIITINTEPPALPAADIEAARGYALASKSDATKTAYKSDFAIFTAWCAARGVKSLPAQPETVAAFLAAEADAGLKPSTIGRRAAAIRYAHRLAGYEPPTNSELVKATLHGIRRRLGTAPAKKAAAVADVVRDMARHCPAGLRGLRDRALILLGFAGAFRRSELVALDVSDITETDDGLRVTIRRSKTDQEGAGQVVAVVRGSCPATCPVTAVRTWLDAAGITEGPVFRGFRRGDHPTAERLSAGSVRAIVQAYAAAVGLRAEDYSAHSLRAGAATEGSRRGASVAKLQQLTRHRSVDVLMGYIRDGELFRDHALNGAL